VTFAEPHVVPLPARNDKPADEWSTHCCSRHPPGTRAARGACRNRVSEATRPPPSTTSPSYSTAL
jgi:hypothetical protein